MRFDALKFCVGSLNVSEHIKEGLEIGKLISDEVIEDFQGTPMRVIVNFRILVKYPLFCTH